MVATANLLDSINCGYMARKAYDLAITVLAQAKLGELIIPPAIAPTLNGDRQTVVKPSRDISNDQVLQIHLQSREWNPNTLIPCRMRA
jgi:hypothetical protein